MYKIVLFITLILLGSCKNSVKTVKEADVYYTCSMDPQVVESKPGKCPICKMDLTPVKKSNGNKKDEIELSEQQVQLGNIRTDTIRNGTIGDQLVLTATLNYDQMKTITVSSRVMGRIEKLYFRSDGDFVKKGSLLYEIYSEELNNAKQEYLLALERNEVFRDETSIDFGQLLQSAKNKLKLWGLSDSQVEEIARSKKVSPTTKFYSSGEGYITVLNIREGEYVMEGGPVVTLADLSGLWAEAQVYTSQLSILDKESIATVKFPDMEGREVRGKISFVNPEINPDTRINLVRVSIPNKDGLLKPGMPAYVVLKSSQRNSLALPIDAVIRDRNGATVWVRTGPSTFKSKMVGLGLESGDRIEIRSGLSNGDVVVTSGAYLVNSEYIFRKGADPMAGHNH